MIATPTMVTTTNIEANTWCNTMYCYVTSYFKIHLCTKCDICTKNYTLQQKKKKKNYQLGGLFY